MSKPFAPFYANDNTALVPALWAQESLAILEENMVAANLVHRDFEPIVAKYGDIVHTRRPGEFVATRKALTDSVTVQDATATDLQVPLNQHVHVSFLIRDGEESKSMQDLISTYMAPAMLAQGRFIDRMLLGQYPQFMANAYGSLLGLQNSNVKDRILGTRGIMNTNKAYMENRNLVITPNTETTFLGLSEFTVAQDVGDQGQALREASLGRKFGFNNYMCQNMPDIVTGNTTTTGAVNFSAGYAKGTTSMVISGFTGLLTPNTWFKVAGDDSPQRIVSSTATLGNAVGVVFLPGLRAAVANSAVITVYSPGAVNFGAGYAAGWAKAIVVNGFTVAPQVGQMVTIGAATTETKYTIMTATTTSITLDRPLDSAIATADTVGIAPAGSYNLAFHKNALTLVVRPLALPRAGTGALSAVVNYNGLSMRATITYDGNQQGHLVTLDMLCGVAILDAHLGAVLLG